MSTTANDDEELARTGKELQALGLLQVPACFGLVAGAPAGARQQEMGLGAAGP